MLGPFSSNFFHQGAAQNTRSIILVSKYAYSGFILLEILIQWNVNLARKTLQYKWKKQCGVQCIK